jgi:hypothetical protein
MDARRHPTRTTAHPLILALIALWGAGPAVAQEAYTYIVRDAGGGYRVGGEAPDTFDFAQDRDPLRVIQGPEWTWVVHDGDALTRETAVMILDRGVPVSPGIGDLVVRGWRPSRVASYDSFAVAFERGDADRTVAGHSAEHYRLTAFIQRTGSFDDVQRYTWNADLWVLPDLPHSWAPFGFGTQSLPALAPRLRDSLDVRLDERGLVGRAVIRMDFAMIRDGEEAGGSEQVVAFQVSDIEATDPPPAAGPTVDRSVMTTLEEQVLQRPAAVCAAAADDRVPDALGDVPEGARPTILATINDGCGSPELYFGMLEDRLESDPDALCQRVTAAENPTALAEAVFTEAQRAAFLEFVNESERIGFHGELRRYCENRGG